MSYWYVIWVLTGHERQVEKAIMDRFCDDDIVPFIPLVETLFKRAGKVKKELKNMYPGYVFVESDLESGEFLQRTQRFVKESKDVIKVLRHGDSNEIAIREDEKAALLRFCNDDYCIESSMGFIKGDRFYIESGPLVGMENVIIELNKKRMEASFEMEFMGAIRRITVGLELLRKI